MKPLDLEAVLAFKPGLRVERFDASTVFLVGERERFVLAGPHMAELVPLIDGQRTVDEILRGIRDRVSDIQALRAVHELLAGGCLVPSTGAAPAAGTAASFWHGAGLDGTALGSMRQARVSVAMLDPEVPRPFVTEALAGAGLTVVDEAPTMRVVVTGEYLRRDLRQMNAEALRAGQAWCLLQPAGLTALVGPFFGAGAGPCWECLAFWIRGNRPVEELLRRYGRGGSDDGSPGRPALASGLRGVCNLAAVAIARAVASAPRGFPYPLAGQLLAIDVASFEITRHAVVKRPQCPACGDPKLVKAIGERPIALRPVEKLHVEDGGYRRQPPQRTYERCRHLVSPVSGAVSHLAPVPGRGSELRAVWASGYLVCPAEQVTDVNAFDKPCAGKGRSAEQARVSALCEALERWSGVYRGDEAFVRGSMRDLGARAVMPAELLHFSDAQLEQRRAAAADPRLRAPEPLDASAVIDWACGWSLTDDERRYVPFTYCYAEAPPECGTAYCRPCGNGVAAGTCVEEALLQGLLELVERDAVAIWWYNRLRRPGIALESFDDPFFRALEAEYAKLGWDLWVLDLTHDLRIPACAALARHRPTDRFAIGFGCHLEPRLAVQRSLTELGQLFDPASTRRAPWDAERLRSRDYLFPDGDLPPVRAQSLPRFSGADLRADIEHCMGRLAEQGLELLAVDKSRPEIDLSVVQVIVPGLRHFWPRFAPGRLYEVPPALGWLPRPLAEDELNPVPLLV